MTLMMLIMARKVKKRDCRLTLPLFFGELSQITHKLNQATNQKTYCNISPEEFEKHFKALNVSQNTDDSEIENTEEEIICFNLLNAKIEEDELKKGLKTLKNNKSTGPDGILNEQIKATFPIMKNIYLQLFNVIFDTGCFPETWAQGLIVPIYKKKGSKSDPNNYRGITLISCLAIFFHHFK